MAEVETRLLIGGGLEAFQETKHVHIETEIAPKEWWYPYSEYSRARDGAPDEGASE